MIDALALLISGHEFWIGFWAGGCVCGFAAIAFGWARFYDAGWRDRGDHDRALKPRVHNW